MVIRAVELEEKMDWKNYSVPVDMQSRVSCQANAKRVLCTSSPFILTSCHPSVQPDPLCRCTVQCLPQTKKAYNDRTLISQVVHDECGDFAFKLGVVCSGQTLVMLPGCASRGFFHPTYSPQCTFAYSSYAVSHDGKCLSTTHRGS